MLEKEIYSNLSFKPYINKNPNPIPIDYKHTVHKEEDYVTNPHRYFNQAKGSLVVNAVDTDETPQFTGSESNASLIDQQLQQLEEMLLAKPDGSRKYSIDEFIANQEMMSKHILREHRQGLKLTP